MDAGIRALHDAEKFCYWDIAPLATNFHGSCGAETATDPRVLAKSGPCEKCERPIHVMDYDQRQRYTANTEQKMSKAMDMELKFEGATPSTDERDVNRLRNRLLGIARQFGNSYRMNTEYPEVGGTVVTVYLEVLKDKEDK